MPCAKRRRARGPRSSHEEINGLTGENTLFPHATEPEDIHHAAPPAGATPGPQRPAAAAIQQQQQPQQDHTFHEQWDPNPMDPDPMFRGLGRLGNGPAAAAQMSLDPAESPQLSVSSDGLEGHFLLSYRLRGNQYHYNSVLFGIVALRFVKFSDQELLVSWCKNCPCGTSSSTDDFFQDKDMSQVSSSSFFNQHPPTLCAGASAFVDSLGKDTLRAAFLHRATLGQQQLPQLPCIVAVPVGVFRDAYSAVRTAASFSSWGVVKHERSGQLLCMSCPSLRRQCAHVSALPPPAVAPAGATWEDGLRRQFDLEAGQRKLTCISRDRIPEDPRTDARILDIMNERASGRQQIGISISEADDFTVCRISEERCATQKCAACGGMQWGEQMLPANTCDVFLLGALVKVKWAYAQCSSPGCCKGRLEADGSEFAVLRCDPALCKDIIAYACCSNAVLTINPLLLTDQRPGCPGSRQRKTSRTRFSTTGQCDVASRVLAGGNTSGNCCSGSWGEWVHYCTGDQLVPLYTHIWYCYTVPYHCRYHAVPVKVQRVLLANVTRVFQRGTLDFIQLQDIDYTSSFG